MESPPAEPQPIVALSYFLRSLPRVSKPVARKERAEDLPWLPTLGACAEPGATDGWAWWQRQGLAGCGARCPHIFCAHPWGCKRTWEVREELQESAVGKLGELAAEQEGAAKLKESWLLLLGGAYSYIHFHPSPKGPPACQEAWWGQAFCYLAYARTSQGNNSAAERGNLGPGYFQPLLFVTQLAHYAEQRAERRDCNTPHVLSDPLILASQEGFVVSRKPSSKERGNL